MGITLRHPMKQLGRGTGQLLAVLLGAALPVISVMAQSNYVAFELERENNWQRQLAFEDLNGDGLKDIVHGNYQDGVGRELHVFHQREDGSFAAEAQRIEIKTEIIAVGFAELRDDPGVELVLLSSTGVFSLSSALEGYAGNIKQLFEWELIAAVPNLEGVQLLENLQDFDRDGLVDFLLPGDGVYGLFRGLGNEEFELVSLISTESEALPAARQGRNGGGLDASISINAEQGVAIELTADSASYFEGFVEQWSDESQPARSLLRAENWMPSAIVAELNGDELVDIAYINEGADGLGQLNIHFQQSRMNFAQKPDWTASVDTRGEIQLVDANGDQTMDLLRLSGEGNDRNAYLYRNLGGSFDLENPNQIMRFSGYDVRVNVIPLAEDQHPIMNVSYYTIPVVDAIRNASINRSQLIFGSDRIEDGQLFNRRPNSRLDESFSAANVRGLSEQMSLEYDVDGDGRKDAIYVTENGTIAAKRIDAALAIDDEPFWEYVSTSSVFEFEVLNLNGDDIPDLLLRHARSTTFLVSAP